MRRCSSSRRGVLSSNCSDRVNSPRLIEWRDERLRGAIAIGAAILPPSAKAGWSTALADLKRWESGKLELSVIPSRGRPRRRTHNRVCPARGVPSQSCRRTLISCLGREWREARQRIGQGYLGYPNCEGLPRWRGAPEPFVLLLAYSVSPERTPPVAHEAPSGGRGWRPRKGSSRQLRTLGERGAPRRDAAQTNWARGTRNRDGFAKRPQSAAGSAAISPGFAGVSCLTALGGRSHEEVYGMLAAMAERAPKQGGLAA